MVGVWQQTGGHEAGAVAESIHLVHKQELERNRQLGMVWAFETSKPAPSDIPPPIRPHLILPKQFYQLGSKHPNR